MSTKPKLPRKPRRDAKLLGLPAKDRRLVAGWLQSEGWEVCLQRIATQLKIECGRSALYAALAFWESEERRDRVRAKALEQMESEAEEKSYTPQQRMAALDRRMAEIFAADDAHKDYQDARYLMIADESARTKAELARLKLAQKDRDHALASKKFRRETCELFLEWFDKETAKQIATSGATNAEKIEQLGLAMFGEDWKQ